MVTSGVQIVGQKNQKADGLKKSGEKNCLILWCKCAEKFAGGENITELDGLGGMVDVSEHEIKLPKNNKED